MIDEESQLEAACAKAFEKWWADIDLMTPPSVKANDIYPQMKQIAWGAFMGGWAIGREESIP